MDVKLEHSTIEDKEYIKKLYQLYAHDLSEFNDSLQLDSAGLFDQSFVDDYYCQDNLIPLKITLQNQIVGFIFCSTGQSVDYIVQDIFVLRNYRSKGVAKLALKQLFDLYTGKFGLDILVKNKPAKLFWENSLKHCGLHYTSRQVYENGEQPVTRLFFDVKKPL